MVIQILESLSKDVFERRTSTGSEVFFLTIRLYAKKFVLISFFSLIRTIYLRVSTKPPLNDAKRPLPVDVRHSKTLLLKLPIVSSSRTSSLSKFESLQLAPSNSITEKKVVGCSYKNTLLSPQARESKTDLNSRFHAMDSGFRL